MKQEQTSPRKKHGRDKLKIEGKAKGGATGSSMFCGLEKPQAGNIF